MYVVYFLRGLADVLVWMGALGLIIGVTAGIVRAILKTRHGIRIDAEDRRPRFVLRQKPDEDSH